MKRVPLSIQVLNLLESSACTTDTLFEKIKPETRGGLRDTLSRLRNKRGFITTAGDLHTLTVEGREYLAGTRALDTSSRQTFTSYAQAKATPLPEVRSVMTRPTWTPPAWTPARPGADDHKAYGSRGIV